MTRAARLRRVVAKGLCLCGILLVAGCGGNGVVSGKVLYQGKAVRGGMVSFIPEGGGVMSSPIEEDGSYTVRGVPPGAVKIIVETDSVRPRSAVQGGSKQGGAKGQPPKMTQDKMKKFGEGGAKSQPPKMKQDKMKQFGEAEEAKVIQKRLAAEEAEKERRYVQIPPQYSDPAKTDLSYVVTRGKQQHDIDLK
jgi:hypothetical protein